MEQSKKSLDFVIKRLFATDKKNYTVLLSEANLKIFRNDANDILLDFTKDDQVHRYKYNNKMSKELDAIVMLETKVLDLNIEATVSIYFKSEEDKTKVAKFIETSPDKVSPKDQLSSLIQGFQSIFIDDKLFRDGKENETFFCQFSKYLTDCALKWQNNEIFAPIATVCQSSGHGKTRCMYEFSKRHFCIYLCLRDENEGGFPRPSPNASSFIKNIDSTENIQLLLYCYIKAALNVIKKLKEANGIKSEKQSDERAKKTKLDQVAILMQMTEKFHETQPWFYDESKGDFQNEFVQELYSLLSKIKTVKEQDFNKLKDDFIEVMTIFDDTKGLYFIFDEARTILQEIKVSNEKITKLTFLRKEIQQCLRKMRVAFLFADTNSKIEMFVHGKKNYSPSERSPSQDKPIYHPFYKIFFIDYLIPEKYSQDLKDSVLKQEILLKCMKERSPVDSLFCYGRPLWASLLKTGSFSGSVLVDLAINKLLCSKSTVVENEYQSLACMCVRTTLFITYHVDYTSEMIAKHMNTLIWVENDRTYKEARYFSEPILAEASAHVMNNTKNLERILQDLNKYVQLFDLNLTGSIGELVVQLMLLLAFDKAARNKWKSKFEFYSHPVTIREFLECLIGKANAEMVLKDPHLNEFKNGYVCFTHFIKRIHLVSYEEVITHFIGRAAAGSFESNHIGNDLFIPVVYEVTPEGSQVGQSKDVKDQSQAGKDQPLAGKNQPLAGKNQPLTGKNQPLAGKNQSQADEAPTKIGKISHILIQVKNRKSKASFAEITANKFPYELKRGEYGPVPPFLPILMDLENNPSDGKYLDCKVSEGAKYFELKGFNSNTYPLFKNEGLENVYNAMKILLNASRTKFSSEKYGYMVLEHVAKECVNKNEISK